MAMSFQTPDHDARWWLSKRAVHDQVLAVANRVASDQEHRRMKLQDWQARYEGKPIGPTKKKRLTFNLTRSAIDTVCAKISKNKPRPQILTSGGDFALQKKAKQLTKFLDGVFMSMDAHEKGQAVFRDACIFDGGALKIYKDAESERICCERVKVSEILVDTFESYYGTPRQMFHRRAVNRDVLAAQFPKHKRAIYDAPASALEVNAAQPSRALVDVVESWHLPSGANADDGRHTMCIEGATLVNDAYEYEDFPFVFFRWSDPVDGFWSPGLAEELINIQASVNRHIDAIHTSHERGGNPVVFVPTGSKVSKSDISNMIGGLIEYDPAMGPPVFGQVPTMVPQFYQFTETLKQWGYEQTGVSQTAARSSKPAGVESGAAIREVNDIETERFVLAGQRYETFFLRVAEWCIRLAREMYEDGVDLTVKSRQRKFLESIQWSDVDMDDDSYSMAMFPSSMLPTQPAGRLQTVVDMATNGLITPDVAKKLLDFPDLEDELSLDQASSDLVREMIDSMLDGGDYVSPEPYINLDDAQRVAQLALLRGKLHKVSDTNLEKVRTFLADIGDIMAAAAAPAPEAAPPAGASALPDATMPEAPPMDTLAASMPPMPGVAGDSMPGNMMAQ
jgi:hypothetical protein